MSDEDYDYEEHPVATVAFNAAERSLDQIRRLHYAGNRGQGSPDSRCGRQAFELMGKAHGVFADYREKRHPLARGIAS